MFSDVNSLIFLLIFLSFMAVCLMVYHRVSVPCPCSEAGGEMLKKLLLCGLVALFLTVAAIYLWYLAVLLLLAAAKYLWDKTVSGKVKWIVMTVLVTLAVLITVAGIQLMICRNSDDDDGDDAVLEDVVENGVAWTMPEGVRIAPEE